MRAAAIALALCVAATAHAGPHRVLVMRAESSSDWGTRASVETVVVGLARNVDRGAGQSETTFKDLAQMMGCTGNLEKCKVAVIDALSVDELVDIQIAPASGTEVKVTVRRATKAGGTRAASAVVAKDNPNQALIAAIGPLFGAKRTIDPPVAKQPPPAKGTVIPGGGGGVVIDNEDPLARDRKPTKSDPPPEVKAPPETKPPPPEVKTERPAKEAAAVRDAERAPPKETRAPAKEVAAVSPPGPDGERVDDPRPRSRRTAFYVGGIAGGVVVAGIGIALWQKAGAIEDEARAAPTRNRNDIRQLVELEERGDRYALWGNVAVVGGVAIAGVSGYLLWRHRRARATRVSVTPVLFDGGGGVAFSVGTP